MLQKKLQKAEEKLEKVQERKAQILEEENQVLDEIKDLRNQILTQTIAEQGMSFNDVIDLVKQFNQSTSEV